MKNFFIVLLLFERLFACAQNSVIQYYAPNPGVQKHLFCMIMIL